MIEVFKILKGFYVVSCSTFSLYLLVMVCAMLFNNQNSSNVDKCQCKCKMKCLRIS